MAKETLTLLKGDVSKEARKLVNPSNVDFKKAVFKVDYVVDIDLAKKMDTDARFVSRLYGDITSDYEELVGAVAYEWKQADDLAGIVPLSDAERKELVAAVRTLFTKYDTRVTKKIDTAVGNWLQVRKDRTKYTRDVKKNIAVGTFSVLSGAGAAAGGVVTGGTSLVLTIITITKGVVAIGKEIKRTSQDVGKAQTRLEGTVTGLLDSYKNDKRWKVGTKEVAKSGLADFFEVEVASIKRADKEFVTYKGKVAPIHTSTADLGAQLHKLLDAQAKLDKTVTGELDKLLAKRKTKSKNLTNVMKGIEKNHKTVRDLMANITTLDKELVKHETFTASMTTTMKILKSQKPGWAKYAEGLVWLASLGANPAINAIATSGESLVKGWEAVQKGYELLEAELS